MLFIGEAFDLVRPSALFSLLLVPLLAAVGVLGLVARRRARERLVAAHRLEGFLPTYSSGRAALRLALACAGLALLALAWVGPVYGFTEREVVRRGLDMVVCLDTSRSMQARDLSPSRMERAIREVRGLLKELAGDRVALLAFSGDVREVSPLTHDRRTLDGLVREVSPADNRLGGTDLGAALQAALELFDDRSGAYEVVVLITDGEDLSGKGLEVAAEAKRRGIRVYVVGVGTEVGGKILIETQDGGEGFLVGPDGEEVVTRLEASSLRAIAEATGGEFLSTEDSPTPLEELYTKRIARLDRREIDGAVERVPHDRFQIPLFLAVGCMLGEIGLRERRRRKGATQ